MPGTLKLGENYCVGGAFLRFYNLRRFTPPEFQGFPAPHELAKALIWKNPNLPRSEAAALAETIIVANDRGRLPAAWQALERALAW